MSKEELAIKLQKKIEKEFADYQEELKQKPIDEIINSSYQTSSKEDIVYCFQGCEHFLSEKQIKALYNAPNSLNEVYDDYSNADYNNMEDIRDSARYASNAIIGKEKNSSKDVR